MKLKPTILMGLSSKRKIHKWPASQITVSSEKFSKIFLLAENTGHANWHDAIYIIIILERADLVSLRLKVKFFYFLRAILSLDSLAARWTCSFYQNGSFPHFFGFFLLRPSCFQGPISLNSHFLENGSLNFNEILSGSSPSQICEFRY